MKISIIGAGNVGSTIASTVAQKNFAHEIVLLDVKEGLAEGKALDIWQTSSVAGFSTHLTGVCNDYSKTADSDIAVITSGLPRKPGMKREDLLKTNGHIVKEATENIMYYSPNAIVIVISNPIDPMTYLAAKTAGIDRHRIFGMAGILDSARFRAFIAKELKVSPMSVKAIVMGSHGAGLVPFPEYTTVGGIPVTQLINRKRLGEIIKRTRHGGGEIVSLMGTSGFYAPGAATAQMVESIAMNQNRMVPVSTLLNGEYGLYNIVLGVPVILGNQGIHKIMEVELQEDTRKALYKSAENIEKSIKEIETLGF
mgnify:CR=1 FL=1